MDQFYARLWPTQIPNLIFACHWKGEFKMRDIRVIDVANHLKEWEGKNAEVLTKFGVVLRKLVAMTKEEGKERFKVRRVDAGVLEILSVDEHSARALSEEMKARWESLNKAETAKEEYSNKKVKMEDA